MFRSAFPITLVGVAFVACTESMPAGQVDGGPGFGTDGSMPAQDGATPVPDGAVPDGQVSALCALPPETGMCDGYFRRFYFDPATGACERFVYGGCEGNDNRFETLTACEEACGGTSEACALEATDPSLPGVRLRIEADRCRVQTGRMHAFRYELEVPAPIDYTSPDSGGGCGACGGFGSDPQQLVDTRVQNGDGSVRYCRCDEGCCEPTEPEELTLDSGTFEGVLEWPGRQWGGPSDTGEPLGEPFPAGHYLVRVDFVVPGVGAVRGALPIEVTADESGGPNPGDAQAPACKVDGVTYGDGARGIADPTSCNTCSCDAGALACTEIACSDACPDGTQSGSVCARCGPADACEAVETGCLPNCDDGSTCPGGTQCYEGVCGMLCG